MPFPTYFNLSDDKKERIMDAAIKEMSLHAYEYVNLANIIRDASIPRGSFYQYFKDKRDLCDYVYSYIGTLKVSYFGDLLLENCPLPFLERFRQIYLKGIEFAKDRPLLVKAGQHMIKSDTYMQSSAVKEGIQGVILLFKSFIIKDQDKGLIHPSIDSELLATLMLDFMNKISIDAYLEDDVDFDLIESKVNQVIDILRKGIEVYVSS
jgi:AcrR family transcriptional regulator